MFEIQFTYGGEEPRIDRAIAQGAGIVSACWSDLASAGVFDDQRATAAVDATYNEVRAIFRGRVTKLRDEKGVAEQWNAAIDAVLGLIDDEQL